MNSTIYAKTGKRIQEDILQDFILGKELILHFDVKSIIERQLVEFAHKTEGQLCGQFGWYGNNINQIAKHLNGGGDQYTVIQWLENYQRNLDDLIIRFKMLMEKKIAA